MGASDALKYAMKGKTANPWLDEFVGKKIITESEINLLMRRINAGKIKPSEIHDIMPDAGWRLTKPQIEKARTWWKKKMKYAGYREEEVIEHMKSGRLTDVYNTGTAYTAPYYVPYYVLESAKGSFGYVVYGGEPHILG